MSSGKSVHQPLNAHKERCALCDEVLLPEANTAIYGVTGHAICRKCADTAQKFGAMPSTPPTASECTGINPRAIVEQLDKYVIGQTEAKRALAVTLWKHLQRTGPMRRDLPETSLLLFGPSGCGKTFLVQTAAKLLGFPFLDVDITAYTESGYKGRDMEKIVDCAIEAAVGISPYQNTVVFIDEIDKFAATGGIEHQACQRASQSCLLKLIEGHSKETENLLFLFGGAFPGLTDIVSNRVSIAKTPIGFSSVPCPASSNPSEHQLALMATPQDFVEYGLTNELVGRIPLLAPVFSLSQSEMMQVLTESQGSILSQYQQYFKAGGVNLSFEHEVLELLSKQAEERGVGARGLKGLVEELMEPLLFDPPMMKGAELTITVQDFVRRREPSVR